MLAVEVDKQRLRLGLKSSYFLDQDVEEPAQAALASDLDAQLLQQMHSRSKPEGDAGLDALARESSSGPLYMWQPLAFTPHRLVT